MPKFDGMMAVERPPPMRECSGAVVLGLGGQQGGVQEGAQVKQGAEGDAPYAGLVHLAPAEHLGGIVFIHFFKIDY